MNVRTRFAPSPTGFLHVGVFRTALYAWLIAKHHGGSFILRIEDTDQDRKVPGAMQFLIEELTKAGITIDEGPSPSELKQVGDWWEGAPVFTGEYGPYIQTLRRKRYEEVAEELVAKGVAYRCDCTAEMLEKERLEQMARKELPGYTGYCRTRDVPKDKPHVIRLRIPERTSLHMDDALRGRITWDAPSLRDSVILKSDKLPTYYLAVVVDDHDMKITHMVRGEEWISTAPIVMLLYQALGWEKPIFVHLPVVMGTDGKKLSKRRGAKSVKNFTDEGYLTEAVVNYICLVGWSPGEGDEQEIFSMEELIKRFSIDHINNANAVFDQNKLTWMNGVYIRNLTTDEFLKRSEPFLSEKGFNATDPRLKSIAPLVQERVKILTEVPDMVEFLFKNDMEREWNAVLKKGITKEIAEDILKKSKERIVKLTSFDHASIDGALRPLAEELGLKVGPMFGVIRVAVMGRPVTPPLFESLAALGKKEVIERIDSGNMSLR